MQYGTKFAMQKLLDEIKAVNGTGPDAHSAVIESDVRELRRLLDTEPDEFAPNS